MKCIYRLIATLYSVFGLGLVSAPARALELHPTPEPGMLALLGVGGVLVLAAAIRNRRK